jgi:hypothetical protein
MFAVCEQVRLHILTKLEALADWLPAIADQVRTLLHTLLPLRIIQ